MNVRQAKSAIMATGLAIVLTAGPAQAEPRDYVMDREHFAIGFLVHHMGLADTLGMFLEARGSFVYDSEAESLSDVEIVVQAASVFTNHEARDDHLRGPDFLNVREYPTMTFTASEAERSGEDSGKLHGELTLLGETRPLTLDVEYKGERRYFFGDEQMAMGISARGTVMRSDYGMAYALEQDMVGDEIELIIEFEAILQEE